MKGRNIFLWIGIGWATVSVAITALCVNTNQSVAGIIFEGFALMALCVLLPLALAVILFIACSLTNKEGRAMLARRAEESQRKRKMKKARRRGTFISEDEETTIIGASEAGWENIHDGGGL